MTRCFQEPIVDSNRLHQANALDAFDIHVELLFVAVAGVDDDQYVKAIQIGGPQQLVDIAKDRRTAIAQKTMRNRADFRPDVMMYITGALDKFASLSTKDVQAIGVEIAILGQNGLDINDPDQKYTLRSLPGKYSGLHLCSIMYAAFKQFAPHEDVGIDFSKEYEAATELRGN
jgi:hypothetical protein